MINKLTRIKQCLSVHADKESSECVALLDEVISEVISLKNVILDNVGQREGYKYMIRELEDKLAILRK